MKTSFLDFEHAIAELEGKIEVLRAEKSESSVDVSVEIALLESKCQTLTQESEQLKTLLGLSEEHEGIILLPEDAPVGLPLRDYLGDSVLELDLTPTWGAAST